MEESISGFKVRGDWGDVVEHGERISLALREVGVDEDAYYEFDEWRPKTHERIDEDVNKKTAEQASVAEGEGEKRGKDPDDDLQTAGEKLAESYEQVEVNDTESASESWGESIEHVARAADSAGRKAIRKVEDAVYRNVMTQMAPYYFDNELVSANVQEVARGEDGETFVFEVNVNDDELKGEVSEVLDEYESEIDRWHVETEKRTDDVAAAEGVEPPAEEGGPDSTTT
jgi:vacuolar-type H+-ATPase subunit I/STV1